MKTYTHLYLTGIAFFFSSCFTHSITETELHQTFKLGSGLPDLMSTIQSASDSIKQFDYTGEMAAPFTSQTQINSYGLEVLGKKRNVEFLFNDGPLGHVWILIEKEEIESITNELKLLFGDTVYSKDGKWVFNSGTVAILSDPPEVLIATPEMIKALTGYTEGKLIN